jgi:hypothetical protein
VPGLADALDQPKDRLGRIADLIARSGIDLDEVGRIDKIRIGEHQVGIKRRLEDGTDEVEVVTLAADSLVLTPTWADGPEWPVVQQAQPVVVKAPKLGKPPADSKSPDCVILPDMQVGYWRAGDDLVPMHDEQALAVALETVRLLRPGRVVLLGDNLDLAEWSLKFAVLPEFQQTTQASVDRMHRFLAELRSIDSGMRIDWTEGNHDDRIPRLIAKNAMAALRLRRANTPESWPVMSVPHLLRLDELDVGYISGYPAVEVWLTDDLVAVHGEKLRIDRVLADEQVSVIQGHTHRVNVQYRTRRAKPYESHTTFAAAVGCLCRTDGTVPSTKGGVDVKGAVNHRVEDWQQAVAAVTYRDGGPHDLEVFMIRDGQTRVRGQLVTA